VEAVGAEADTEEWSVRRRRGGSHYDVEVDVEEERVPTGV
jgi:ribosomal protein S7